MAKKYIDTELLINTVDTLAYPVRHDYGFTSVEAGMTVVGVKRVVDELPAADVQEVKHGKWIWDKDGMDWGIGAWRCSVCETMSPMWWNTDRGSPMHKSGHYYCPRCGAKMDLDEVE